MKKVLLAILSLCLIAASLFGLFTGVAGMKDVLNIKDYKTEDQDSGLAQINDELLPGIQQLKENLDTYLDGVAQFEDGKAQVADGEAQLAAGAAQLRDGEAQLAAGKAELAANTDAYNKGKELQGTLNTVNGLIGQWKATKEAIVNGTSDLLHNNPLDPLDLGGNTYDAAIRTAEQTFLSTVRSVLSTPLITQTLGMSIDIPQDADNFPNWFCLNYAEWINRDTEITRDSDDLLRLIAPRLCYVASATLDPWAGPPAEKEAWTRAHDIWQAYGCPERMGYHIREGKHKLTEYDWNKYMDFADKYMK